jgi:serine/threonine protein kinase
VLLWLLGVFPDQVVEAGDATSYAAGAREAAVHALAGRHPNVVSLLDAFEHRSSKGRHAAMVLEQCGSSLDFVSRDPWRLWGPMAQ